MDDTEADIVVRFDLHVALLNGATKRLKVHAHLGNFNFDWSQDKRMVTGAFLLGVQDTLEDLTLVLELVLRLDLFRDVLQEVQNGKGQSEFLLFFIHLLHYTLLVLYHDGDSHADRSETELRLEESSGLGRSLLRVTNQIAEDVVYDCKHELCLACTHILRRHHL